MEHAGGSFVRASSAGRPGCCRCNDLENSASGVNVSKPASCGRAHVPSSGAHARARDFMKTIVSAATARNDDVRSDVNSRSLRSTNLKGIIFHATSHTRALARTTPVDRNTPPARSLAPDELRGEPAVLSARVERRIGSSVRYRPVTEKKLGHVSEISLFILFYFIFFFFHRGE